MARYVLALIVAMAACPGWAQPVGQSVTVGTPNDNPSQSEFSEIIQDVSVLPDSGSGGSRIVAGTEVAPNAVIGIGAFGYRAEKPMHSLSTARDLATARSRKTAVGFSLRF